MDVVKIVFSFPLTRAFLVSEGVIRAVRLVQVDQSWKFWREIAMSLKRLGTELGRRECARERCNGGSSFE